jgi:dephospho-CoA kinase
MPPAGQIIVGLIGGIACGKSTVARMFRRLGAVVIDADRIARGVLQRSDVKAALRAKFADKVVGRNGTVSRRMLAAAVFKNTRVLKSLNRVVHPHVLREMASGLKRYEAAGQVSPRRDKPASKTKRKMPPIVILDAPLLLETGLDKLCSHLVFVEAPLSLRRSRAVKARAWSPAELTRREAFQTDLKKKRAIADFVVNNAGSLSSTRDQVKMFFASVRNRAKSPM